ncbi:MAG: hypothetical protein AMXMBFR64_48210 [Myxococcales bacterium]
MKIADVARYRPVIGSAISSDGRWAAAVVPRLDRRTRRKGPELLLGDLDARGPFRRLATDDGLTELYAPTFSPDSRRLAALVDEGEGQRGVLFDLVGEPRGRTLRGVPPGARALGWRGGVPSCLGDDADGCRRVWAWSTLGGLPAPVTPAGRHAGDFAWRPDGQRLAWLEIPDAADEDADTAVVHLVEADGATRAMSLLGHPVGWLAWSPDGRWLAYCARRRGVRLSAIRLWVVDPDRWPGDAGAIHCVTRGLEGWLTGFDWASDGSGLVVAMVQGTEGRLWHVAVEGDATPVGARGSYVSGPHTDRSRGRMLLLEQDLALPQRLVLSREGAAPRAGRTTPAQRAPRRERKVLLRTNGALASTVCPGETVSWTAGDGVRIDGVLIRTGSRAPAPLLVWLHGGPADHVARTFSPYFQVFASAGYAVLAPNYRGSTGRDEAFLRGTVGALGVTDAADVLHGIDRLVQMGVADPQRTAAVGWSYGGTLALTLAMRTDLFGALVVGAPVVDWVAFTGAPRFPLMLREYFPTPFWEDRAPWDQASPLTHLERLHTPTLVLQGGLDRMNPPSQARALYRALRAREVETDLMVYPYEGHIPTAPDAVCDMLARILRWLGRHVRVE